MSYVQGVQNMVWEPIVTFIVPGPPRSKERPRFNRKTGAVYTPKTTKEAERAVVDAFELAAPLWEPTLEDCRLSIDVIYQKARKGDGGNVLKMVEDALNGWAYRDDKQVVDGHYHTFENGGDRAGVVVTFYIHKGES
jgi:crossover junction endodeoxyribonuclease RusA